MVFSIKERMAVLETDIKYIKKQVDDNKSTSTGLHVKVDKVEHDVGVIIGELKSIKTNHLVLRTDSVSSVVGGGMMAIWVLIKSKFGGLL